MLRNERAALLILVVFLLTPNPILASHSQGLEWGFSEDDRFDFMETHLSILNATTTNQLGMSYYAIAPVPPDLDDPLCKEDYMPYARAPLFYPNGTQIYPNGPKMRFAVPIGNWSLLSQLMLASLSRSNQSGEIQEDNDCWGYDAVLSVDDFFIDTLAVKYSKADGVLLTIRYNSTTRSGRQLIDEIIRQNSPLALHEIARITFVAILVVVFIGLYQYKYKK